MKLEQQVVSLSLAKRLKELGVKQNAHFAYIHTVNAVREDWRLEENRFSTEEDDYAAFTVAELGEMLPDMEHHEKPKESPVYISTHKVSNHHWRVSYSKKDKHIHQERAETEAEARGLMLAYLLENNLMTV